VTLQKPKCRKMENSIGPLQTGVQDIGLRNIAACLKNLDAGIA
jgi:hypothetical protein